MESRRTESESPLNEFVSGIKAIIDGARSNAVRSVDFCRVRMYWAIGQRITEKEQQGKERADYGTYLIRNLAKQLQPEYGSGFSARQLEMCRQFYRVYPIANALRSQLSWTQYRALIQIPDPDKREYYELEAVNEGWTGRQLERQINSMLYERLLMSNDKEKVLALARNERPPEPRLKSSKTLWFWSFSVLKNARSITRKTSKAQSSRILRTSSSKWERAFLSWPDRKGF